MQLKLILAIGVLGMSGSLAAAQDVNCTGVANPQARQECLQRKYDGTADCTKLVKPEARKECAEYKMEHNSDDGANSVDCGKLASPEARRQCMKQKAK